MAAYIALGYSRCLDSAMANRGVAIPRGSPRTYEGSQKNFGYSLKHLHRLKTAFSRGNSVSSTFGTRKKCVKVARLVIWGTRGREAHYMEDEGSRAKRLATPALDYPSELRKGIERIATDIPEMSIFRCFIGSLICLIWLCVLFPLESQSFRGLRAPPSVARREKPT